MFSTLSAIRNWLLNLFFPSKCVSCGAEGAVLCASCFSRIKRVNERISVSPLDGVFSIYRYEKGGTLQKAVKAMKYRFIREVTTCFPQDIGDFLEEKFDQSYLLVTVPLHRNRERWRGFNQAEEIVRGIDWPRFHGLIRHRHTEPQAELNRAGRLENLRDAFSVTTKTVNKKFILVDDICTTGATLSQCANALKKAGASEVWGVVLGHG